MGVVNPFVQIRDVARAILGKPVRLDRWIRSLEPAAFAFALPSRSVAETSIVRWHELGQPSSRLLVRRKRGEIMGWHVDRYGYSSLIRHCAALERLSAPRAHQNWQCDISAIEGFSASKSDLHGFTSMEDFAISCCPSYIADVSSEGLQKNLRHSEIRIIHGASSDHFVRYAWDGRVMLANSGGSHHLAAASYIAKRLGEPVPLTGTLYDYRLDPTAVAELRAEFDLVLIPDRASTINGLFEGMKAARASFYWLDLPSPLSGHRALLLPKTDPRCAHVFRLLTDAGAFDLGSHLSELIRRQRHHDALQHTPETHQFASRRWRASLQREAKAGVPAPESIDAALNDTTAPAYSPPTP